VTGMTLNETVGSDPYHDGKGASETWQSDYASETGKLYGLLHNTDGILFVSGDVHYCGLRKRSIAATLTPYPVIEVITSGIGRGKSHEGFATLEFDTRTVGQEAVVLTLFKQNGRQITPSRAGGSQLKVKLADLKRP
jgi:hypothetical protein